uniref:CCPII-S n=1 Tax=Chroomonas placoidea TaxID=173977 RepID=UPI0032B08E4C
DHKRSRMMKSLALAAVGLAVGAEAFAPTPMVGGAKLALRTSSTRSVATVGPKMAMDVNAIVEGAQYLTAAVPNVPFVDEITGEPQGLTAPIVHFGSVISLWLLFALPVWSAAYKAAGADTAEWVGVSQVTEDAPGIGLYGKYAPEYDGPTFREGLEYVLSFAWKPPILIAWKPRADLDRAMMDPARDTVVSSLYKSLGGALDKTAVYDEEDQLLILSDMETFPETELGRRRVAQAEAAGWFTGNPSFGKSLIEYSEETKKGMREPGTVSISAKELAALRAEAAKK